MMSLLGADVSYMRKAFLMHKIFQVDGFLTLIILGVGYMIVPRFRNIALPSKKLAFVSLILIFFSISASIASSVNTNENIFYMIGRIAHILGVIIFGGMVLWMLRIRSRLLRTADYFIALSVMTLVTVDLLQLMENLSIGSDLSVVQVLLLFAVLMILGIEYKTLPSFLGFIRPARKLSRISFGFASASVLLGVISIVYLNNPALAVLFNVMLLGCSITFANSVYIFGGFDNTEILRLMQGEKKARYIYTIRHSRLAFVFLFAGTGTAAAFITVANNYMLYDLAIHYTAIGFIGITIALYLPLMLPPITGRIIHFTKFNNIPITLVVLALLIRTLGDFAIATQLASGMINYIAMVSGWLIVSAIIVFIKMIYASMREIDSQLAGSI